jgi:hypothetical protein
MQKWRSTLKNIHMDNCPTCNRPLAQERGNEWRGNHSGYMRFYRRSLVLKHLCSTCGKVPPRKGIYKLTGKPYLHCRACQRILYSRKRKAAIIHSRICACGQRAARQLGKRYYCRSCWKKHQAWLRLGDE